MSTRKSFDLLPFIPSFFDDFFTKDLLNTRANNYVQPDASLPAVNIVESHEDFMVEMAAPGMDKADFQIELDHETLTISSKRDVQRFLKNSERYTRREFNYQSFSRSFYLPKSVVDVSSINAIYDKGILRVTIPKREEAKSLPPRIINIS